VGFGRYRRGRKSAGVSGHGLPATAPDDFFGGHDPGFSVTLLASSRCALLPTQRDAASFEAASRPATTSAAPLSVRLRLPTAPRAIFTAFLTKLRGSEAAFSTKRRAFVNCS